MRIAFVWDWPIEYQYGYSWLDGLAAAIRELSSRHSVKVFAVPKDREIVIPHPYFDIHAVSNVVKAVREYSPDVILLWGDRGRPNIEPLSTLGIPMAMCFSGGSTESGEFHRFKHIVVENECYRRALVGRGFSTSIAFGTNTDIFKPLPNQQKVFDVCFPATYARWKRHKLFKQIVSEMKWKACTVGYPQPFEMDCWEDSEQSGALVLPYCSSETVARIIAASRCVVITSNNDGGSQRTVLEALAMNVPVVVNEESQKNVEFPGVITSAPDHRTFQSTILKAFETTPNTKDEVDKHFSHLVYASQLEEKLYEISNRSK